MPPGQGFVADITKDQATPWLLDLASSRSEKHQTDSSKKPPSPLCQNLEGLTCSPGWLFSAPIFHLVLLPGFFLCLSLPCSRPQEDDPYSISPGLSGGSQWSLANERPRSECGKSISSKPRASVEVAVPITPDDSSCQAALNLEFQLSLGCWNSICSPGPCTLRLGIASSHCYSLSASTSLTFP